MKDPYARAAPDPSRWEVLVAKIIQMDDDFVGFLAKDIRAIQAPTLIILGDRDGVRPEHAVETFRLIPNSQLAILPGGDHFTLFTASERVLSVLVPFLEAR